MTLRIDRNIMDSFRKGWQINKEELICSKCHKSLMDDIEKFGKNYQELNYNATVRIRYISKGNEEAFDEEKMLDVRERFHVECPTE